MIEETKKRAGFIILIAYLICITKMYLLFRYTHWLFGIWLYIGIALINREIQIKQHGELTNVTSRYLMLICILWIFYIPVFIYGMLFEGDEDEGV